MFMASFANILVLFLSYFCSVNGLKLTNITANTSLRYPDTLVSDNAIFELGFFSPGNSTNYYVGIWYANKESDSLQVIWVANRDKPLTDSKSGVLRISEDGNLQLLDNLNNRLWASNVSDVANRSSLIVQLEDTGNLVLLPNLGSDSQLWQSFDHLTNRLLPQMMLSVDQNVQQQELVAWRGPEDPATGRFRLGIVPRNPPEFFVWDGDQPYWRTGPWVGNFFIGMPLTPSVLLDRFTFVNDNQGSLSFTLLAPGKQSLLEQYVLSYDGTVNRTDWNDGTGKWVTVWTSRVTDCDVYGKCGEFGVCNPKKSPICGCLKGFEPKNKDEWSKQNWTSGCVRRKALRCETPGAKADGFLRLKHMKVPDGAQWLPSNGTDDCRNQCLGNCSCSAYTYYSGFGCMIWKRNLIDIQNFFNTGVDLYIRSSEIGSSKKWIIILIAVLIFAGTSTLAIIAYYLRRRKYQQKPNGNRITTMETHSCNDNTSVPNSSLLEFKDLPMFKFEELLVATNNFQEINKLGEGGFGPVYKGTLEDGQQIAVKRLARASGQGVQEFMNEVLLISKLQHRNLVRLLGCCVEGEEKMLVYEYMPNKSLDAFLFDPAQKEVLDWKKRVNIIEGISRGILYLHRDSRLKVIHRDLKVSNVLLDEDLNPKISDFGMARIFEQKEDQANTLRVVGTLGYMAPEYAMEGRISEKSDVYSFGVLLLEIISGRRIKSFENDEKLSLVGHAWKLWHEDDILSLVDSTISNPTIHSELWRCIQIGLLCVQEFPEDRPTISDVITMLRCEISDLPYPTQPGYLQRRNTLTEDNSSNSQYSVNLVSLTRINGR